MRRHGIGILAILLFCGAAAFRFWPPSGYWQVDCESGCWRVGLFCAIWWLAWPQAKRVPLWIWFSIPMLILVLILRPKLFLVLAPLVVLLAFLFPRSRPKTPAKVPSRSSQRG